MSTPDQPPPQAQLLQVLFGFMVTRSVSAVAELNVPDALSRTAHGPSRTWRRRSAPTSARCTA